MLHHPLIISKLLRFRHEDGAFDRLEFVCTPRGRDLFKYCFLATACFSVPGLVDYVADCGKSIRFFPWHSDHPAICVFLSWIVLCGLSPTSSSIIQPHSQDYCQGEAGNLHSGFNIRYHCVIDAKSFRKLQMRKVSTRKVLTFSFSATDFTFFQNNNLRY